MQRLDLWHNVELYCQTCGKQIGATNYKVAFDDNGEHIGEMSQQVIERELSKHNCKKEMEVFKPGQWVINERTNIKAFVSSEMLAKLMNDQRKQGLNSHLKIVEP